jgi:hypothetical protein
MNLSCYNLKQTTKKFLCRTAILLKLDDNLFEDMVK